MHSVVPRPRIPVRVRAMWRWILGCWLLASSVSAQDGAIEESAVESTPSTEASAHESSDSAGAGSDATSAGSDATGAGSDATVPSAADPADASDGSTAIAASSAGNDASTPSSASESPSDASNDGADASHPVGGTSDAQANAASPLRQHFVFLRPGWMPHVTVGYRSHTIRFGGEREKESSRGITSGAVFPIVASGGDASRVRFALAAGLGIDFAHYRHRVVDELMGGVQPLVRGYVQRTRYFYGQVGGLLRVSFGRNALVTSLLWLPGRRTRFTEPYEEPDFPIPEDADDAMLARGRLSLALVRSHFHAGFFVGLGHANLPDERGVEIEYALQIGTGW